MRKKETSKIKKLWKRCSKDSDYINACKLWVFSYSAIKKPAIKVLEVFLKHTRTHTLAGKSIPSYERTVVGVQCSFSAPGRHSAPCRNAEPLKSSHHHLWKAIICCTSVPLRAQSQQHLLRSLPLLQPQTKTMKNLATEWWKCICLCIIKEGTCVSFLSSAN